MTDALPDYEVLAIRFGSSSNRPGSQNFIMPDGHDGPMQMDFYVWAIRHGERTIVVDTGFSPGASTRRNRQFVHPLPEALAMAGVDPAAVSDVVITHLHWDHAGNIDLFPKATFHIQDAEMAQATGRCICHKWFRRQSEVDDVVALVRNLYAGRVAFHDGAGEIAPGVTVHLIGGHTGGPAGGARPHGARLGGAGERRRALLGQYRGAQPVPGRRRAGGDRGLCGGREARRRADPHHPGPRPGGADPVSAAARQYRHRPGRPRAPRLRPMPLRARG